MAAPGHGSDCVDEPTDASIPKPRLEAWHDADDAEAALTQLLQMISTVSLQHLTLMGMFGLIVASDFRLE